MTGARCLLLTSFTDSSLRLKEALKSAFLDVGIETMHPVDMDSAKPLLEGMAELIKQAKFVVADVSDLNPNVLLEIGIAIGEGLPTVVLADHKTDIPVSLSYQSLCLFRYDKEKGFSRRQALDILSALQKLGRLRHRPGIRKKMLPPEGQPQLANPFDYFNAETMKPELIERLFVTPPYFGLVSGPETVVLFGPRGCGKTTLLHMLRFRRGISQPRIAGFYVDFNRTLRGIEATAIKSSAQRMTTYFNFSFLQSFVNETDVVHRSGRMSENEEKEILLAVERETGITSNSLSALSTVLSLYEEKKLARNMFEVEKSSEKTFPATIDQDHLGSPAFLSDLAHSCKETQTLSDYSIAYLIDDYSSEWLPENVRHALHQIIFQRSPWCTFKVATTLGRNMVWSLSDSEYAEPCRDFVSVNMTDAFFTDKGRRIEFLRRLINKRLMLAGVRLTSEMLFSSEPARKYPAADYSGIGGFARLFSGDCATIITACYHMTHNKVLDEPISREFQNTVIRSLSAEILESLKEGYKWGPYVFDFVSGMMQYIRTRYLLATKADEPRKRRRGPISGIVFADYRDISAQAKEKLLWLSRSGVLLPYSSYGREQRYAIRGMLFPAFGLPVVGTGDFLFFDLENSNRILSNPKESWVAEIRNLTNHRQSSTSLDKMKSSS